MIVIIILGILAALGIPGFIEWKRKVEVENAIKELYSLLQEAKAKAFAEKRVCGLSWDDFTTSFNFTCDNDDDGDIDANDELILTKNFTLSFNENFSGGNCTFDDKGFFRGVGGTFWVNNERADYSCVVVSRTRIRMGKFQNGECQPK
jgi:Tfp pilus assembly protein FimT